MYICICKAVTEKKIRDMAIDRGMSAQEICSRLGVASDCGQCVHDALGLISEERTAKVCMKNLNLKKSYHK